jgi:hypothetical protein
MRFFASEFFHESVSSQPQSILFRPFRIFSKIRGDIRESRCTTGINNTGGKFATGVNDIGGKIAAGINDWYQRHRWQIFPPFLLALLIPVEICHRCQRRRWQIATGMNDTGGKFATGVVDSGGK